MTFVPTHSRANVAMGGVKIVSCRNPIRRQKMSVMINKDPFITAQVMDLVLRERAVALSSREWKHRLAGYGYAIKSTDHGEIVETLPHHVDVGVLPDQARA
jgi:hypothetical protein